MKGWLCTLLLLETFVFVVQQQIDGGLTLRELTATVTEQKAEIRALETRLREELNKKTDEISALTQSQVEELRKENREMSDFTRSQVEELKKENRDRQIAFSTSLMESGSGHVGPFTTDITLIYKNIFTNIGNAYNPITGVFTAPLKGAYRFTISVFGFGNPTNPTHISIMKNGKIAVMAYAHQNQGSVKASNGVVLILEVGDVVHVRLGTNSRIYDNHNNHVTFSGYLLFPLRA
ncbi:hypothetical protein QQF64_024018 [Cirrhinus molitorella]|uniref:C1q domain-containing protein n=1 Tax=Cirrhinus molitorella TaxID=172907 RepID=A0ABR3NLA0_9TELE